MATPEELAAQQAEAAALAKAAADAAAQTVDVDLFDGVKILLPKEQAVKVIAARDAFKAEVKTAKDLAATLQPQLTELTTLRAQLSEATTKVKDLETKLPGLLEAQQRAGDLTVKVTALEAEAVKAKANEEALTKILDAKLAELPDNLKVLVKGGTVIDRMQSFEELSQAGVFKTVNIGQRHPSGQSGIAMTTSQFNALSETERANVQQLLKTKQMAPLIPG